MCSRLQNMNRVDNVERLKSHNYFFQIFGDIRIFEFAFDALRMIANGFDRARFGVGVCVAHTFNIRQRLA